MANRTGILSTITTFKNLTTLIVDFDQLKHTEQVIYNVIKNLTCLKRLGRLGRVDKKFWRLFKKGEMQR